MLILVDRAVSAELSRYFTPDRFQTLLDTTEETLSNLIEELALLEPGTSEYRRVRHDLRPMTQQFGLAAFWAAFERLEPEFAISARRVEAACSLKILLKESLSQLRAGFPAQANAPASAPTAEVRSHA
ncbi:MAG: hypothetical protein RIB45_02295 [Marivibrio sp.]|uniref:hypothetical protein n=1 Tax=Marivibrio sp. TaxID=2039719 RepID=UPI0032EE8F2D